MGAFTKGGKDGKEASLQAIRTTAAAFEVRSIYKTRFFVQVDFVLVIEDGFLTAFLKEDLPKEVTIVCLPKSSGAVNRSPEQWMRERDSRVRAYFHGENPQRRLHPHQLTLNTSEVS